MSRSVLAVRPDTPSTEIAELLYSWAIGAVPVLDNADRLIGVVAGADLLRHEFAPRGAASATGEPPVAAQLMTRELVTVHPSISVDTAAEVMLRHNRRWLPVCEGDQMVGVVSRSDLLRTRIPREGRRLDEVEEELSAEATQASGPFVRSRQCA